MSAPLYEIRPGGYEDDDSDDDGFFLGSIEDDKKFATKPPSVVKFSPENEQIISTQLEKLFWWFRLKMFRP